MITIRNENRDEYQETESVIREAFWNHYSPGCNDHYLVHIMRDCPAFIPELDLIAVDDNKIIGATMSLKSCIKGDDGKIYDIISLGPIGVRPDYQRQGIGGMLLAESKEIARQMGYRAIFLCGDPDYYTRQGFVAAEAYGIRNSENMFADALHGCELYSGALTGMSGRYFEDEIYAVEEAAAEKFDKGAILGAFFSIHVRHFLEHSHQFGQIEEAGKPGSHSVACTFGKRFVKIILRFCLN